MHFWAMQISMELIISSLGTKLTISLEVPFFLHQYFAGYEPPWFLGGWLENFEVVFFPGAELFWNLMGGPDTFGP